MNASPFDNLPPLDKDEALEILSKPINQLELASDYYKAVFHLSKYPGYETEEALIDLVESQVEEQSVLIAKRKAIEYLARLNCTRAIPLIGQCLKSKDPYTVENSAWALQQLGCDDPNMHRIISSLIEDPNQNQRALIQSLAKMGAISELSRIKIIANDLSIKPGIRGAAIAAIARLTGCSNRIKDLEVFLKLPNQNDKQCAVQDVIDAKAVELLPEILKTPVAPFFRMRAVNELWPQEIISIDNLNLNIIIDSLIKDNPNHLELPQYFEDCKSNSSLVKTLFGTDFSRSYFALKNLINFEPNDLWPILLTYWDRVEKDYGAIYFFMLLFSSITGWNKSQIEKIEILALSCLDSYWPEYMKFRPVSILTLIKLDPVKHSKNIPEWLDERKTPFWASRYATLMAIESFTNMKTKEIFSAEVLKCKNDTHRFVRAKANIIL